MRQKLVVIGNGMAPGRALEQLFELAPDAYDVTIFNAEPRVNYDRIMLSPVLSGEKTFEEIVIHGDGWYVEHGVTLYKGHKVVEIDRDAQTVTSAQGVTAAYDKLIIATGSMPIIIPVPGHDLAGVLTYRDLDDVDAMLIAAKSRWHARSSSVAVYSGLEAAAGLQRARHGRDRAASDADADGASARSRRRPPAAESRRGARHRGHHQGQHQGDHRADIRARASARPSVELDDGTQPAGRLVVMAVGIRPNASLAKEAGLDVKRGIVVDGTMRTSDPDIFALGECAEAEGQVFGLVAPLYEMANVVAAQLAGDDGATFNASATATKLKVTGINLFSAGDFADGEGPRGNRAARRGAQRLQAACPQGRPPDRRRPVRRHAATARGSST